jgi:hypothetical protein
MRANYVTPDSGKFFCVTSDSIDVRCGDGLQFAIYRGVMRDDAEAFWQYIADVSMCTFNCVRRMSA